MRTAYWTLAACCLMSAVPGSPSSTQPRLPTVSNSLADRAHDFDFLFGEWRVHHRVLKASTGEWMEFEGTSTTRPLMNGSGNVEDNFLHSPSGEYRAVGLRAFDAKTGEWAIWWVDGRNPLGPLDPPVRGHFENGVGSFYMDGTLDGRPMRTRYLWSHITATSARWEQGNSFDGGKTWDTNWTMEFRRVGG